MRPESRTFDPTRFHRNLRNLQLLALLCMLTVWSLVWGPPQLAPLLADAAGLVWKLCLFAAGVWLASLAKEGLRFWTLRHVARAKPGYVKFGVVWSRGAAAYAKCMAAVDAGLYRRATLLPGLVMGWIPLAAGLALGAFWLFSAAALLSAETISDMMVLWSLRRLPKGSWVQDSPFAPGCDVYLPQA